MDRLTTISVLISGIIGYAGLAAPVAIAAGRNLGSIMPLGDSITAGASVPGGYRATLYDLLHAGGDTFSFVGSSTELSTGVLTAAGQDHHEGHGGYFIRGDLTPAPPSGYPGLYENLGSWIGPNRASPDIILLMVGINDIGNGYQRSTAPARLNALIDRIYAYQPKTSLFVASITPVNDVINDPYVQSYNASIPSIVNAEALLGRDIHFVDMYHALSLSDISADGVHPNSSGYAKIGQTWYTAINTASVPEPSTVVLSTVGVIALAGWSWLNHRNKHNNAS